MTLDEQKLHSEKNSDYAKGGNPLGNFTRVAAILSNYPKLKLDSPTVIAIVYAMKQLDAALWMLNEGYEGKVENIDTRLQDVHVYMKLARILEMERKNGQVTQEVKSALKIVKQGGINAT
jgi:hypothetical protein